jgi:hypothetical protein
LDCDGACKSSPQASFLPVIITTSLRKSICLDKRHSLYAKDRLTIAPSAVLELLRGFAVIKPFAKLRFTSASGPRLPRAMLAQGAAVDGRLETTRISLDRRLLALSSSQFDPQQAFGRRHLYLLWLGSLTYAKLDLTD